jgi:hypothetical protein
MRSAGDTFSGRAQFRAKICVSGTVPVTAGDEEMSGFLLVFLNTVFYNKGKEYSHKRQMYISG